MGEKENSLKDIDVDESDDNVEIEENDEQDKNDGEEDIDNGSKDEENNTDSSDITDGEEDIDNGSKDEENDEAANLAGNKKEEYEIFKQLYNDVNKFIDILTSVENPSENVVSCIDEYTKIKDLINKILCGDIIKINKEDLNSLSDDIDKKLSKSIEQFKNMNKLIKTK